jgi:RimJ/RimL family protein N-acetyltransferase
VDPEWTHIGTTGFHQVDWKNRTAELGIVIGDKEWWGRGYGTDAVRALARWALDELALNRLWLRVYEDNARAIHSYEKVGFKVEGRLRQDRFHGGRYFDTVVMGLLRDELVR